MLQSCAWSDFIIGLLNLLFLYYAGLLWIVYGTKSKSWFPKESSPLGDFRFVNQAEADERPLSQAQLDAAILLEFLQQLRIYLQPYRDSELPSDSLYTVLQGLLIQYPAFARQLQKDQLAQVVRQELAQQRVQVLREPNWDLLQRDARP